MSGVVRSTGTHVVIVGGGVTGAGVALHLASSDRSGDVVVTVIEPRAVLGGGLAYSTPEPSHRVNVPASRMSLLLDEPEHFARWLAASGEIEADPGSVWANGDIYPRRRVFARYVEAQLAPHLERGDIRHERVSATHIECAGAGWSVGLSNGNTIAADAVVLAATHPLPAVPDALTPIAGEPGFIGNPYGPDALAGIAPDAKILIVGAGLTSADMVAELDRKGHQGAILALSRHGLRSRGHPARRGEPFGDFTSDPAATALGLLRNVRATVAIATKSGVSWHSVFDRLRADGPRIWSALPVAERAKLVRRLRVFWDVHRFRIAPQVEAVLDRRSAQATFKTVAAHLVDARHDGRQFVVRFRRRGRSIVETLLVDIVINTTGPAHRAVLHDNASLRALAEAGHIRFDPFGLGIETSRDSRAISRAGQPVPTLFVAGPLSRGTFGELMGLPEVVQHALAVAREVRSLVDKGNVARKAG